MTKMFQVINNRIQFRCYNCKSKRNLAVRPDLRKKRIACYKCGELTTCILNRRSKNRDSQAGIIQVVTASGIYLDADLRDISNNGVGFNLHHSAMKKKGLTSGSLIRFECNWNPKLLGNSYFMVKNVQGQRIGAQKNM